MKIFLSYPSARRGIAERLKLALEAEQHEVFYDRDDLPAGETFHLQIRQAIEAADLCVFLIAPEAVANGSYTLAELDFVQRRWPQPARHVLPVIVAPTPHAQIPPYLLAVTLLEPRGEIVAETVARIAAMGKPLVRGKLVMAGAVAGVLVLAAASYWGWQQAERRSAQARETAAVQATKTREAAAAQAAKAQEAAAAQAAQQQLAATAARALALCQGGAFAEGFAELSKLVASDATPGAAPKAAGSVAATAQQDCAMSWLRSPKLSNAGATFESIVVPLKQPLAQALVAGASGPRAGDLHAHLAWADVLIGLDGRTSSLDPQAGFQRALVADPTNVYGHAMWASWILRSRSASAAEAFKHFEAALASGRDNAYVRRLQLGMMAGSDEWAADALRVLNDMRLRGERVDASHKSRIWNRLFARIYSPQNARRLTDSLPPAQALETFLWLFVREELDTYQRDLWRLAHGLLLTRAGRPAEARPDLEALRRELKANRSTGSLLDAVEGLLAEKT